MASLRVDISDDVMARFKEVAKTQVWRGKDWLKDVVEDALLNWADENDPKMRVPYGNGRGD